MKFSKKTSALFAAALFAAPFSMFANTVSDHDLSRDAKKNMPDNIAREVSVSVNDGIATVTGTVETDTQRGIAISAVKQVPQIKDVNDEIKVSNGRDDTAPIASRDSTNVDTNGEHHSDKWIAMKVKSELLMHSNVSATHTDVNVAMGVVTLSGTAKSEAQKELTEQYAKKVEGVVSVNNQIQIADYNTHDTAVVETHNQSTFAGDSGYSTGNRIDDSSITTKVKYQLAKHKSTSAFKTEVHTKDGVVWISGTANNAAEKDLVTKLAQDVPGVNSVKNDMDVVNQ